MMTKEERRYDIDWLRVIAIGLLLIYHIAIAFQPWGVFIGFIQNNESLLSLWTPMTMLNVWRIPLLFYVSGMGIAFAIRKRNWKQLLGERSRRILVPFLFGMFVIVPLHFLIWQKYYNQDLNYIYHQGHLWFLKNIFIYVLVLSPIFFFLKKNENKKTGNYLKRLFSNPLGLILIMLVFIIEVLLVKPESFELYAMTTHGFFLGMTAFLFGFCLVISGPGVWNNLMKWRYLTGILALSSYVFRIIFYKENAPHILLSVESNLWIFTLFGFAYKYLNHPGKTLKYLSQAAYPVYIIHMFFLYLGSYFIFPMEIPVFIKFTILLLFTFLTCFGMYELLIRRINIIMPLFGLKKQEK